MSAGTRDGAVAGRAERALRWPGDPEGIAPGDIDFIALAHVLANTCRFGGRTTSYHSLAAHAVIASEEIEALDGLDAEERRRLALHALIANAPSAWLRGEGLEVRAGSQRAAEPGSRSGPGRTGRLAAGIERAVREAAGLDPVLDDGQAELLRFIARMTSAAERRDLVGADVPGEAGAAFPPLKRRIRPLPPGRAAKAWLARFRALGKPPGGDAAGSGDGDSGEAAGDGGTDDSGGAGGDTDATKDGGTGDVAHIPEKEATRTPRGGRKHERQAA